ncbi:MAG: hypothetical protein HYS51_01365 [Candidatus Zambryskibacteria bacterium]|nr:hypothetical protein [Candidatus Zambryskibacteria bacterium]
MLYQIGVISMVKNGIASAKILFYNKSELAKENAELKERVIFLETTVTLLENNIISQHEGKNVITARVLSRPPENPYDMLTVSIESGGVAKVGSPAFLPNGLLAGRVSESSGKEAKVKLFSTVNEKTSAILERNSVPVETIGLGGGNFKVRVSRDVSVEKEDKILFSKSHDLLAVVEDISMNPTDPFKDILAKSPLNIFTIELFLIEP